MLVGGQTLHSFAGIGVKTEKQLAALRKWNTANVARTKVLVIDEVSMVPDYLFTFLDRIFRETKGKKAAAPFGGASPRHKHVRVVLTAGVKDQFDEAEARRVQSDGVVQKPFQASLLLGVVKPLAELAANERRPGQAHPLPQPGAPPPRRRWLR